MYEHIVLLKFKDKDTTFRQEEALQTVQSFKASIPGILSLSAGINVTEETEHAHGYSLGMRVTFEDQQACRNYLEHPLHQQLLQDIGPWIEDIVVADYSF